MNEEKKTLIAVLGSSLVSADTTAARHTIKTTKNDNPSSIVQLGNCFQYAYQVDEDSKAVRLAGFLLS